MKNSHQLRLFLVNNPVPFARYEDHEAAIYIELHELMEDAKDAGEDPAALMESYLGTTYPLGHSDEELAAFLFQTGAMQSALNDLKENWDSLDENVPGNSLIYGGVTLEEVLDTYSTRSLRAYLEALTALTNEDE